MYNKKSLSILVFFFFVFIFVLYTSLTTKKGELNQGENAAVHSVEKSSFKKVHYFKLNNLKPNFELKSDILNITDNTFLEFDKPIGVFISKDKRINYKANSGHLNQKTKKLNLHGDVNLTDENSDYISDELMYDGTKEVVHAKGNVSTQVVDEKTLDIIKVKSNKLTSYLTTKKSFLDGKVQGRIIRKRSYEGGLKFWAEKVELNPQESRVELNKSVKIHRNNYYLTAEKAEIFLENFNKKLKYYTLYDDVKLEEKLKLKSGQVQTRRAYAEKLDGHQRTGKIILTGAPRVEQGRDIIKGYQITLRENVEMVEVDDAQSNFTLKKDK